MFPKISWTIRGPSCLANIAISQIWSIVSLKSGVDSTKTLFNARVALVKVGMEKLSIPAPSVPPITISAASGCMINDRDPDSVSITPITAEIPIKIPKILAKSTI